MNNDKSSYSIAAPISCLEELEKILKMGANEIYFGILTDSWKKKYGDADFMTRRQSEYAHISSYSQLSSIVQVVSSYNAKATLVLNSNYSEEQMPYVFEIISEWEDRGGHALMISDLGILLKLNSEKSRLARYLSVMAGVFNHDSVSFFYKLNVSRIVLPRELRLKEMYAIVRSSVNEMEFEAITMFQKCQYIDSFCNFIHAVDESSFPLKRVKSCRETAPFCHGCELPLNYNGIFAVPLLKDGLNTPYCGACQLSEMLRNGIRYFKIAGRGYPSDLIIKAISLIKNSIDHNFNREIKIKDDYKLTFGKSCGNKFCYYS